jgi:hypothetical protein
MAADFSPPLRSTIAVPLLDGDRVLGVLSGYSVREEAFNEAHRYTVERVAVFLTERFHAPSGKSGTVISFPVSKPS